MDGGDRIEITVLGGLGDDRRGRLGRLRRRRRRRGAAGRSIPSPPTASCGRSRTRARSAAAAAGRRGTSSPAPTGVPIAVMPLYAKGHSQGEYIFDHNWAHAWERAGGRYYPKLQAAVPFTPATGRRFLTRPGFEAEGRAALLQGALALARQLAASRACTSPSAPRPSATGARRRASWRAPPSSSTGRTAATPTSTPSSPTSPRASARRSARSAQRAQAFGGEIVALTGDALRARSTGTPSGASTRTPAAASGATPT